MQKRSIILFTVIVFLVIGNVFQFAQNYCRLPRNAVPNEEVAISITRAAFSRFYEPIRLQSGEYLDWSFETSFSRFRGEWIIYSYLDPPEGVYFNYRPAAIIIRMRDGKIMGFYLW